MRQCKLRFLESPPSCPNQKARRICAGPWTARKRRCSSESIVRIGARIGTKIGWFGRPRVQKISSIGHPTRDAVLTFRRACSGGNSGCPTQPASFFALALGLCAYRIETRRVAESVAAASAVRADPQRKVEIGEAAADPAIAGSAVAGSTNSAEELSDAGQERELLLAQVAQRDKLTTKLQRQIEQQSADLEQSKTRAHALSAAGKSGEPGKPGDAEEKIRLLQQSTALGTRVADLQKQLDTEQQALSTEAARRSTLEVKLAEQEAKIDQQQELLAHDRDIRELMGARDLYVAEVYDERTADKCRADAA
jgi:hypothetical protein